MKKLPISWYIITIIIGITGYYFAYVIDRYTIIARTITSVAVVIYLYRFAFMPTEQINNLRNNRTYEGGFLKICGNVIDLLFKSIVLSLAFIQLLDMVIFLFNKAASL